MSASIRGLRPLTARARLGVVAASAAGFGLGLSGLPFYTSGVFVQPLRRAFGWPASKVQLGLTLLMFANMATLPTVALAVRRFGARKVALVSVVLFALAFMSFATQDERLSIFYVHWLLLSVAGAGTLSVTWSRTITAIFAARRGLALGSVMVGSGVTALVAPVAAGLLIQTLGWRLAYLVLGSTPLFIAAPMVWLLFFDAAPAAPASPARSAEAAPPRATIADPRFWIMGGAFLLVGGGVSGALPNLVKVLTDRGLEPLHAAGVASFMGLFVIVGRLGGGYAMDRLWAPLVSGALFGAAALGAFVLQLKDAPALAVPIAAAGLGSAAGLELDVMPYFVARYFPPARFTSTLALLSSFFFFGAALGPFGFAWLAEASGGDRLPLDVDGAAFLLSGLGLLCLGPYPQRG